MSRFLMHKMREEQTLSPAATKTAVSWTGGKDCNLALLHAWRNPTLNVVALVVFKQSKRNASNNDDDDKDEDDDYDGFHAHPIPLMKAQACSLGLDLRICALPSNVPYKEAYVNAIRNLRDDDGIMSIATGDMDPIGTTQSNWIQDCCNEVGGGVRAYLPLWKAGRLQCLNMLLEEDFTIIYSCVKSPWFDKSWVGRRIDQDAIRQMKQMSTESGCVSHWSNVDISPRHQRLDLGGENGEYHTMCLDGPLYLKPIPINSGEPKEFASEPAKEGEKRWWTYDGQRWWTITDQYCDDKTSK